MASYFLIENIILTFILNFFILYRNPNYRPPSQAESTEMEQVEDDHISVTLSDSSSDTSSLNDNDDSGLNFTESHITPSPTRTETMPMSRASSVSKGSRMSLPDQEDLRTASVSSLRSSITSFLPMVITLCSSVGDRNAACLFWIHFSRIWNS